MPIGQIHELNNSHSKNQSTPFISGPKQCAILAINVLAASIFCSTPPLICLHNGLYTFFALRLIQKSIEKKSTQTEQNLLITFTAATVYLSGFSFASTLLSGVVNGVWLKAWKDVCFPSSSGSTSIGQGYRLGN